MFSTPWRLCCSIWCTATWQAYIALQMVARNGKPDVYRGAFSSTLSKDFFLCIVQLFLKTGQYQMYFPHFPLGALDEDVFLCNRCEEGGILGLHNSPFLAPSRYTDASQRTDWEARRLEMGTIWFSSDCEHNLTRTQRVLQATSFASSRPCEVTNEATPSHQQITHDTIIHTFLSRSLSFLKWG